MAKKLRVNRAKTRNLIDGFLSLFRLNITIKLTLGFTTLSKKKLQEMTYVVHRLIDESNSFFVNMCGKKIPRLCVAHDIWESKLGHWIGITLFVMSVSKWKLISMPIGFRKSIGKKSIEIVKQVEHTLAK